MQIKAYLFPLPIKAVTVIKFMKILIYSSTKCSTRTGTIQTLTGNPHDSSVFDLQYFPRFRGSVTYKLRESFRIYYELYIAVLEIRSHMSS